MSGDVLQAAAIRIRHDVDFGQAHGDDAFLRAVADQLDATAERHEPVDNPWNVGQPCCQTCGLDLEGDEVGHCDDFAAALAVARAYLGETS